MLTTVGAKEEIASATTKANWFKLEQAQTAKQKLIHLLLCDGAGPQSGNVLSEIRIQEQLFISAFCMPGGM